MKMTKPQRAALQKWSIGGAQSAQTAGVQWPTARNLLKAGFLEGAAPTRTQILRITEAGSEALRSAR